MGEKKALERVSFTGGLSLFRPELTVLGQIPSMKIAHVRMVLWAPRIGPKLETDRVIEGVTLGPLITTRWVPTTKRGLAQGLLAAALELLDHEARESILVDGERFLDPHRKGRKA